MTERPQLACIVVEAADFYTTHIFNVNKIAIIIQETANVND